jgi:heme/copper-type cytochrome/quinol oxidase subunit 2
METIFKISRKHLSSLLLVLAVPFTTLAEHIPTAAEEAAQNEKVAMYSEIAIAILFVVAVTLFLIFKSRHEKKLREKHIEQMKKVQAAKKKAA